MEIGDSCGSTYFKSNCMIHRIECTPPLGGMTTPVILQEAKSRRPMIFLVNWNFLTDFLIIRQIGPYNFYAYAGLMAT